MVVAVGDCTIVTAVINVDVCGDVDLSLSLSLGSSIDWYFFFLYPTTVRSLRLSVSMTG